MMMERKVRSLGFIAAFLLVTNIIMLIFFLGINDSKKTLHLKDGLVGNYLKKDIGFSENQMQQYRSLRKNDMDSMKSFFTDLHTAKDSFYRFVTFPSTDSELITYGREIGNKQMSLDIQMLAHFKKVRALCTAEQKIKFDSSFKTVISKITAGRMRKNYKEQEK